MMRRYAVVRGATLADEAAAIETSFDRSLDSTLTILSVDGDPAATFVGDGGLAAVIEYTADELRTRRRLTDWMDWTVLDQAIQEDIAEAIALEDIALGKLIQASVVAKGWLTVAATGTAQSITELMEQQLNTSYAAAAANNGALSLTAALVPLIPDSVMTQAEKDAYTGAIEAHFVKWPRPTDDTPILPPQIQIMTADFDFEVYVPAYIVDASAGNIEITLPPFAKAGVLPYWWTRFVCRPGINSITFTPDGAETIDGAASLVISVSSETVVLGGSATEWNNVA